MKILFICHSSSASSRSDLSGIFLQKDCGQAAMTAFNTYFRVNDETADIKIAGFQKHDRESW